MGQVALSVHPGTRPTVLLMGLVPACSSRCVGGGIDCPVPAPGLVVAATHADRNPERRVVDRTKHCQAAVQLGPFGTHRLLPFLPVVQKTRVRVADQLLPFVSPHPFGLPAIRFQAPGHPGWQRKAEPEQQTRPADPGQKELAPKTHGIAGGQHERPDPRHSSHFVFGQSQFEWSVLGQHETRFQSGDHHGVQSIGNLPRSERGRERERERILQAQQNRCCRGRLVETVGGE
mmetsp:Transcript_26990/g.74198  ORF Transcript_26990/g.74198 Transcript_26990/m.74198 type:complete len:232 (-) Transcript_26990:308-1003(-)